MAAHVEQEPQALLPAGEGTDRLRRPAIVYVGLGVAIVVLLQVGVIVVCAMYPANTIMLCLNAGLVPTELRVFAWDTEFVCNDRPAMNHLASSLRKQQEADIGYPIYGQLPDLPCVLTFPLVGSCLVHFGGSRDAIVLKIDPKHQPMDRCYLYGFGVPLGPDDPPSLRDMMEALASRWE